MELKHKIVLLVDDEEAVRRLIRTFLESMGVYVLEAESAPTAAKLAMTSPLNIDLLITDVLLPHINGRDLANKVCMHRPDIKVLFISGYPSEVLMHHGLCPSHADLLLKPFSRQELLEKVQVVMQTAPVWKTGAVPNNGSIADTA